MMKIILITLLTLITLHLSAQEKSTKDSTKVDQLARNEIKLNLLTSVLSFPEINYERIFKNNTSIGIAAFFGFKNTFDYNYGFIGSYRVYFSKSEKLGTGFFYRSKCRWGQFRKRLVPRNEHAPRLEIL